MNIPLSVQSRSGLEELLTTLFDNLDSCPQGKTYSRVESLAKEVHELATLDSIALLGFVADSLQNNFEDQGNTSQAIRAAEQTLILAHSCYELSNAARVKGGANESGC